MLSWLALTCAFESEDFMKLLLKVLCSLSLIFVLLALGLLFWGGTNNIIASKVAVVLGNQVFKDGTPSDRLAARLDKAFELYSAGQCEIIIVSGGQGQNGVDESAVMARYLEQKGLPKASLVLDPKGYNTWQTALFTARYLKEHGFDSVIAVTQDFHIPRTVLALERAGCPKVGKAAAQFREWRDLYSIPREMLAIIVYYFKTQG